MINNWKTPILAAIGLVTVAAVVPIGIAYAQETDQRPPVQGDQRGRADQGFQGGAPMPDMAFGQRPMGMMGGGEATMVADNQFLYILRGNTLTKVDKNSLRVVGEGSLPMPQMQGGPSAPGAAGFRGGAGGGGATRTGGGGGD